MKRIIDIIKNAERIAIISHRDPDGDALGSQLALGLALESLGKKVICLNYGEVPEYLAFLPGSERIITYNGEDLSGFLAVYVDCADLSRTGLPAFSAEDINIDHHISNDHFAEHNLIDVKAAATGEIIYKLLLEMGIPVNPDIATNIYTALSTDTGSFLFSNTTPETHRIASELMEQGADTDSLRENFFEGISFKRFELTRYAYKAINFALDNQLAWIKIPCAELVKIGAKEEDTEGLVNHLRNIKDVEVAMILKERGNGKVKGSLRSKKLIDVSDLASRFGGGGHKRAAGFEIEGTLEEAEARIIAEIKKEFENV